MTGKFFFILLCTLFSIFSTTISAVSAQTAQASAEGSSMKKILIFGITGTVGEALAEELSRDENFEIYGTYFKDTPSITYKKCYQMDIADPNKLDVILNEVKPDLVVSALRGDFQEQLLFHKHLAEYLKVNKGICYFCSTANVFDKDSTKPHYENDVCESTTDYGKFKIECEKILKEILGDNAVILRFSQIWGKTSPRMVSLLEKLQNNEEVEVYSNAYMNRITDKMVAKKMAYIIKEDLRGIFHIGTVDPVSEKDFVTELIEKLGYKDVKLKETALTGDKYYLSVLTDRDWPEDLVLKNADVIEELTR
jgi:dTDP-4-dehydrorhamnose reductase